MQSVLIIGLGRFGRHMAQKLIEDGNEVLAVEKNEERADNAVSLIRDIEIGDATNEDFIRSLGVDNFDMCVVAIGDNFQAALEVTVLLKDMGSKFVIARASRDVHKKLLLRNGADHVVYAEREMAERLAIKYGDNNIRDYIELSPEYSIYEIAVPTGWCGKSILEKNVREAFKSQLVLADGTRVTMKASSSLRYPASFDSELREVWLDGEAYFDVEHDAEHPFIVHSRHQSVRVLGTTFNVQAYSNEEVNTVTLLSGAVGLDLLDTEGRLLRTLRLHPNEQCRYDTKDGSYELSELDAYERQCSWADGAYRFRDQSLEQIAARLQNYYGVKIILADDRVGSIRYTGSFSLTERLDEVFSILNHDGRLSIEREGQTYRIRKK